MVRTKHVASEVDTPKNDVYMHAQCSCMRSFLHTYEIC